MRTRKAALDSTIANLEVRAYELEVARARLTEPSAVEAGGEGCCVSVPSPADGRVLRVLQESETVVRAGATLVEIGDPSDLEVVVDLLSTDAVRVRPGAPAEVVGWGRDEALAARVRRVEPFAFTKVSALGIEEQRVNVVLDLEGDAAVRSALGHGYRVEARIEVARAEDAVKAPLAALFREGDDWAAFVVRDGRARLTRIRLGLNDGRWAEVTEGLQAGETLVAYPSDRVVDGVRVTSR